MRSISEIIPIISSFKMGDDRMFIELSTDEIRLFIDNFDRGSGWINLFRTELNNRISKERNDKLDDLGI